MSAVFFSFSSAKIARLKQAKDEAEKEAAEFRAQMEAQFQKKLTDVRILILTEVFLSYELQCSA